MENLNPESKPQVTYAPTAVPIRQTVQHLGRMYGIIGIVCGAISILLFPPLFGAAGIILGIVAKNKGENSLGLTTIILSAVFMVIGMILGVVVWSLQNSGASFIFGPFLYLL